LRELEDESEEDEEDEKDGHEEEEEAPIVPGKWYYFGMSSFWELLGNVVVLLVLFFFAKEFLQSRGMAHILITHPPQSLHEVESVMNSSDCELNASHDRLLATIRNPSIGCSDTYCRSTSKDGLWICSTCS
jgi:hypothetical protein